MEQTIINFVIVLVRVSGFVVALPNLGSKTVPLRLRVGLVVALTWMWTTGPEPLTVVSLAATRADWPLVAVIMIREAVLGALLGFLFRLFLLPARVAGAWLGQEMSFNMASLTSVSGEDSTGIVATFLSALGTLLFFGLNMHHLLLLALDRSFQSWPVGTPLPEKLMLVTVEGLSIGENLGYTVAGPAAIICFLVLITLLLMGKASPHFNLMTIGLSLRVLGGLIAIMVFMPEIVSLLSRAVQRVEQFATRIL